MALLRIMVSTWFLMQSEKAFCGEEKKEEIFGSEEED
jgi:hypothetical protein